MQEAAAPEVAHTRRRKVIGTQTGEEFEDLQAELREWLGRRQESLCFRTVLLARLFLMWPLC